MKKKICLLLTLVVSLFVFSGRVEAGAVMYMECNNMSDKGNATNYTTVVRIFSADGDASRSVFITENMFSANFSTGCFYNEPVEDNCWIKNINQISENCSVGNNAENKEFSLDDKICPGTIRLSKVGTYFCGVDNLNRIILAGQSNASNIYQIEEDEYIIYKINSKKDGKIIYVGEAYSSDGSYSYFNRNFNESWIETYRGLGTPDNLDNYYENEYIWTSLYVSGNTGSTFWKVSNNFNSLYPYVSGYCSSKAECETKWDYEEVLSSNDNSTISTLINEWFSDEANNKYPDVDELYNIVVDDSFNNALNNMIETYESGFSYKFLDGYSASQMLDKLQNAYTALKKAYDIKLSYKNYFNGNINVDIYSSAESYVFKELFDKPKFEDLLIKDNDYDYILNSDDIEAMIINDIDSAVDNAFNVSGSGVNEINIFNKLDDYNNLFLKAVSYFKQNIDDTDLDDNEKKELSKLKDDMTSLGEEHDVFVVITCDDLISDALRTKILSYINIVRIAIPVMLIGFGIFDFTKAIFSGNDEMKKAQTKFLKRIFIAVLFFFVPVIVNLILHLANEVWSFINPSACIF